MAAKKRPATGTSTGKSKSGSGTTSSKRPAGAGARDGAGPTIKKKSSTSTTKSGDAARPRIRSSHSGPSLTGDRPRAARSTGAAATTRRDPTHAVPRPKRPKATLINVAPVEAPARKEQRPNKRTPDLANGSLASDEGRALATTIAIAALEKKAVGLEILDVAGRVDYADFLVLMTGRSDRQVVALAQGIEDALRQQGKRPLSIEGLPHASWVLMDFGDVVVHVFQDEARSLYDLEGLWMDARRIPVPVPDELLTQS